MVKNPILIGPEQLVRHRQLIPITSHRLPDLSLSFIQRFGGDNAVRMGVVDLYEVGESCDVRLVLESFYRNQEEAAVRWIVR